LFCLSQPAAVADELAELINRSLAQHPSIHSAAFAKQAEQHQHTALKAAARPQIQLLAGVGIENSDTPNTRFRQQDSQTLHPRETSLRLTQSLFDKPQQHQVAAQSARIQQADWQQQQIANQLALRISAAYLNLAQQHKLLELAKDDLVAHQKTHKAVLQRYQHGAGRKSEPQQVASREALSAARLIQTEGEVNEKKIRYQQLTGENTDRLSLEAQTRFDYLQQHLPSDLAQAQQQLASHPQLQAAIAYTQSTQASYQQQRAKRYPELDLELNAQQYQHIDGIAGDNNSLSVMLRLRYNLYQGGANSARQQAAKARHSQAQADAGLQQRELSQDLASYWQRHETAVQRLHYLQQHVKAAFEVLQSYEQQHKLGQASLIAVLDAKTEWYNATAEQIKGDYALKQSLLGIFAGMGQLIDMISQPIQ